MKLFKTLVLMMFCFGLLSSVSSCAVIVTPDSTRHGVTQKDNGNHNGWYKNPKNPHNPNHGKDKGNHKK